jgi:hypothetical protein
VARVLHTTRDAQRAAPTARCRALSSGGKRVSVMTAATAT